MAGAVYFALAFAAGWMLGLVREFLVVPRLGRTAGILIEAPLMLAVIIAAAHWTVRSFSIPAATAPRAATGLFALVLLLAAEFAGIRFVRGVSLGEYLAGLDAVSGGVWVALLLVFAAMPLVVARR